VLGLEARERPAVLLLAPDSRDDTGADLGLDLYESSAYLLMAYAGSGTG